MLYGQLGIERYMEQPPTRALLEALVKNELYDELDDYIKKFKLKLKLEAGKLVEIGESTEAWLNRFITVNPAMLSMKDDIRKLAPTDHEVLISGPTGTGKEILARALHGEKVGKFQAINCAGLPDNLIESIIFGHKKGSFTGATEDRIGLMKLADKGTFFLDEVGELPMSVQGKFLRAIQEKEVLRVGADKEERVNCRIVCATNKDLSTMCKAGTFRLDLYARLSTFEIDTLPLLERLGDETIILKSMEGGQEFIEAYLDKSLISNLDVSLNVRSLQQHVKRFKVLGKLPSHI